MTDRTKANRRMEHASPLKARDTGGYIALSPERRRSRHEECRSPQDLSLNNAIDALVAEMSRAEPDLLHEDAHDAVRQTVHNLLRDAGKVG